MLNDPWVAALHTIHTLVHPADRRAKRDPGAYQFALLFKFLKCLPNFVCIDLRRAHIVQLHDVDAIRLEPLQTFFRGELDVLFRKILCDLALPLSITIVVIKIIANLGGDHNIVSLVTQCLGEQFLAPPVAVGVSRIV